MLIKGYEINSEIYRGPITTVYDARHKVLGRRVLLKVLNAQWTEDVDLIERFRREAKICARLDHPNIVKIFDFSTSTESIYISMEYVEGSTLEMLIKQDKINDFSEIIKITLQTLNALSYAHDQGVIHRDIKPSNILISDTGEVKITDFGLAVVSDLPSITGQNQVLGSPAYMSPEQALGKELDPRTDLFSLGVSLYKACTKTAPFETNNIGSTIQNILTKKVKSLHSVKNTIPEWYSDLIDSLLAKEVKDRLNSASTAVRIIKKNLDTIQQPEQIQLPKSVGDRRINNAISKIQSHIFLWVVPVILLLSFFFIMPTKNTEVDQTGRQDNYSQMQKTMSNDSIISDSFETMSIEKNIYNKNSIRFDSSDFASNIGIVARNDSTAETSAVNTPQQASSLFIIANPWADVYIDSIYHEATPFTKPISLEPGSYLVELKNPNYQTFARQYFLQSAQSETLIADLKLNVGFLYIRVFPWANIYIDGEYQDTTPIEDPIKISEGEHVVTLNNPNFESIQDTIQILSGKVIEKRFNFLK